MGTLPPLTPLLGQSLAGGQRSSKSPLHAAMIAPWKNTASWHTATSRPPCSLTQEAVAPLRRTPAAHRRRPCTAPHHAGARDPRRARCLTPASRARSFAGKLGNHRAISKALQAGTRRRAPHSALPSARPKHKQVPRETAFGRLR